MCFNNMFFSLKKHSKTTRHKVQLVKDQCRSGIRKYSLSQRKINEWNKLSTDCVTARSVFFKLGRHISQEGGLHVYEYFWTLDKPMASFFTCHLGWQILLYLS